MCVRTQERQDALDEQAARWRAQVEEATQRAQAADTLQEQLTVEKVRVGSCTDLVCVCMYVCMYVCVCVPGRSTVHNSMRAAPYDVGSGSS